MAIPVPPSVDSMEERLRAILQRTRQLRQTDDILPPLSSSELLDGNATLIGGEYASRQIRYALVEAAARRIFHQLLATASIEQPEFVEMWNLLDILQLSGDLEECEPALALWLVEELLDSQSIDGCRKVFDYLESRRERLVAKHFKNKNLVILRSCNELLRRLSRAEDAVFCGRVFIFLFQSFPLGDKSSVNLRGEFHVENVTSFEEDGPPDETNGDVMDVDGVTRTGTPSKEVEESKTVVGDGTDVAQSTPAATGGTSRTPEDKDGAPEAERLYPTFWKLQQAFSNPPLLFKQERLDEFKIGLESTLLKFKQVQTVQQARKAELKRGVKRKHDDDDSDDFASTYNPKYLTSRDLFKLELSDLDFQRHFLVQALILIDFLLSLTEPAKQSLSHLNIQRSLQYEFTMSEEDAKWAVATRDSIVKYIKEGREEDKGKFFVRMVDTILLRDKNWVTWKMESCPPIARDGLSPKDFLGAKTGTQRSCASRPLKKEVMGAPELAHLSEAENANGLDVLKEYNTSSSLNEKSLIQEIQSHELDLDLADDKEKEDLQLVIASKTWKCLRVASRSKLRLFDKIDDGKNLQALLSLAAPVETRKEEETSVVVEGESEGLSGDLNGRSESGQQESLTAGGEEKSVKH